MSNGSVRQAAMPGLLARVATGDVGSMRECLATYGGLVWAIARRFDAADAEDAVQEIFLELWRHADRYDPSLASETAFVGMVARRRLIDRRRARRRRPTTERIPTVPPYADESRPPDLCVEAAQAARAVAQLRPEQQEVLVLAVCHGLSHSEIAERTGMPLGTVKAHARRGLSSIRSALLGVPTLEAP